MIDLSGRFQKGVDPKLSAVDGTAVKKPRKCPFMSKDDVSKNCVGDRCMLWVVEREPNYKRIVKSDCSFVLWGEAIASSLVALLKDWL